MFLEIMYFLVHEMHLKQLIDALRIASYTICIHLYMLVRYFKTASDYQIAEKWSFLLTERIIKA